MTKMPSRRISAMWGLVAAVVLLVVTALVAVLSRVDGAGGARLVASGLFP